MKKVFPVIVLFLLFFCFAKASNAAVPDGSLLDGIKPGPDGKIDVLFVSPHPDDESIYAAGTLILMKQNPAVRVHILCLTTGDLSPSEKHLKISKQEMGRIRVEEMKKAATVIGADSLTQFDYHDQGLAGADQQELARKVGQVIKSTGAEIVICYGPDGITHHPDHVTSSRVVTSEFKKSSAQRLYYISLPEPAYPVYYAYKRVHPERATIRVDIRSARELKMLALDSHSSQKYFDQPGLRLEMSDLFRHEYFALAAENPAPRK